jgi:hypothetical protein
MVGHDWVNRRQRCEGEEEEEKPSVHKVREKKKKKIRGCVSVLFSF